MTKEMKKKYYDNNKEKLITYQVNRYRELSGIFNEWRKSLVCSKCGENDKACLEFHHCEPAEKEQNVIKMVARGLKSVLRELNKCIVVKFMRIIRKQNPIIHFQQSLKNFTIMFQKKQP